MNITREKIRNVPTIEDLRRSGHKVRVYHARWFRANGWVEHGDTHILMSKTEMQDREDCDYHTLLCYGGYTRIDITTLSGSEYSAKFNVPSNHQFNRKRGIRACIGKIIKAMSN